MKSKVSGGCGKARSIKVAAKVTRQATPVRLSPPKAVGPAATIHAVDRDRGALAELRASFVSSVPVAQLRVHVADFTKPLELHDIDGVVMANSLHFVADKAPVLKRVRAILRPGGRFVLVEYDSDRGNDWVPYPLSFETWTQVASEAGFVDTRRLATVPSRFLGRIYSALSLTA